MREEELWETCLESWNNMRLETIARAYSLHHQIINAIFNYSGSNNYLYEKKGLHFNSKKHYHRNKDGRGVHSIMYMKHKGERSINHIFDKSLELKYDRPNISTYQRKLLTHYERKFLENKMDSLKMSGEVKQYWDI